MSKNTQVSHFLPERERLAFILKERSFAECHRGASDESLLDYVRSEAERLGRVPKKAEVAGYAYLKSRFGPWPRVLERAGLKEPHPYKKTAAQKRAQTKKRKKQYLHADTEQGYDGAVTALKEEGNPT